MTSTPALPASADTSAAVAHFTQLRTAAEHLQVAVATAAEAAVWDLLDAAVADEVDAGNLAGPVRIVTLHVEEVEEWDSSVGVWFRMEVTDMVDADGASHDPLEFLGELLEPALSATGVGTGTLTR